MNMETSMGEAPAILGLFEKRIDGDDCLLMLAQRRFREAALGAEMHAGAPDQLEYLLRFRPSPETPVVVHLPRDCSLLSDASQRLVMEMAAQFAGRLRGLVVHDRADLSQRAEEYRRAARDLNHRLTAITGGPMLFIEYAAGLEPADFLGFFESIVDLPAISACLDIGHVGIRQAQRTFAHKHPGQDVCALRSQPPGLERLMDDVTAAAGSALPVVLELIQGLGRLKKPLHFHLHDGHPLSTASIYGVADHLSFLEAIALTFDYRGRWQSPLMYGPEGLGQIARAAVQALGARAVSFTIEIHPGAGRLPLGDAANLFGHWVDKTHAEQMHQWIAVLIANQHLLQEQLARRNSP